MEYISIYYNEQAVLISKDFAELIGLRHGQRIGDWQEFAAINVAHCEHQIKKCDMLIAAEKNLK